MRKRIFLTLFMLWGLSACTERLQVPENDFPFMQIENGEFTINTIVNPDPFGTTPDSLGSGSISFRFDGDTTGAFSSLGVLLKGQREAGVGGMINLVSNTGLSSVNEALSIFGVLPAEEEGKADIFLLTMSTQAAVDSLRTGKTYFIGLGSEINGFYLKGLEADIFWEARSNYIDFADESYILADGSLTITERMGNIINGTFSATTDPTRVP